MNFSEKTPFPNDPFFRTRFVGALLGVLDQGLVGDNMARSPLVGALVVTLKGTLMGALVDALVGPLVGQNSLSPALCVAQSMHCNN